jgi:outer membrane protein assembly factor BamA
LKKLLSILLIISSILGYCCSSCSITKNVPPGDQLYTGANIVDSAKLLSKLMKSEMASTVRPKPNSSFLGVKFKLMLYNAIKEPKKPKGLFYKLKHKTGQAPVLLSSANTKLIENRLNDYLFNHGYFKSSVTTDKQIKKQLAHIDYRINPGTRHKIRSIYLPKDSSALTQLIALSGNKSLLKSGDYFDLQTFKNERVRIEEYLKEKGYFYFEPDFILFRVDSLHNGEADLYVTIKPDINPKLLDVWTIGKITLFSNYKLEKDSMLNLQAGIMEKKYTIIDPKNTFKPNTFERSIALKQDGLYNKELHNLTIERLMNLNSFRFVKLTFFPHLDSMKRILDAKVYLTPAKKQTVRLEVSANTKSNNFVGTELSVGYKNLNVFRGAEILDWKILGGFDVQIGGKEASANSYTFTSEMNLYFPRLIPKYRIKIKRNPYIPRTVITPAIEYLRRPDLYTLRSLRLSAGYHFKTGKNAEHRWRVININAINPTQITPKFDSTLAEDVTLKAAFERQLVIGSRYQYTFNNTYRPNKFNYAFDAIISTSGNVAGLIVPKKGDTIGSKKLFNIPLSQFVKFQADWRGYWEINRKLSLIHRAIFGVAFAYGNSSSVPYSEQFFIGGSSSIRAFRIRTLGPGSFRTESKSYQANESGEIKLEMNLEARYSISKLFKLAVFTDVGNIWLRKDAIDKPGSGLDKGDLYKELAVGAGIGFRIDASVLVLRFDVATPLRKPWYNEGNRWVLDEIRLGDKSWRKENLILNIGIGYPF